MRTLLYTLGLSAAIGTSVLAQQNIAGTLGTQVHSATAAGKSESRSHVTVGMARFAAMPMVSYYSIAEGEDENFPPGLYATFLPNAPDTVTVFEAGSASSSRSFHIDAGREMIHGDSVSVFSEIAKRKDSYAGLDALPVKTRSFVTRSGYIPIEEVGKDRFTFAVKPSHFRIAPGAMISVSVHLEGDEDLRSALCMVSAIDYEQNTFTIETSRTVPVGETINWLIVNYPE